MQQSVFKLTANKKFTTFPTDEYGMYDSISEATLLHNIRVGLYNSSLDVREKWLSIFAAYIAGKNDAQSETDSAVYGSKIKSYNSARYTNNDELQAYNRGYARESLNIAYRNAGQMFISMAHLQNSMKEITEG